MNREPPLLDLAFCRGRQDRLRELLIERDLAASVLTHRHYVHTLTGYWHRQPLTDVAVVVRREGPTVLVVPEGSSELPVDGDCIVYVSERLATLVESPRAAMFDRLIPLLPTGARIGWAGPMPAQNTGSIEWVDVTREYQYLRRTKDPDETEILRFAIRATESAYEEARRMLPDCPTEVDVHAAMYAAALRAVGEPLSGWGNDFQCGSPGGLPRHRRMEFGELVVLDIGVGVRGYRSDLCRTFAVDGQPTHAQMSAQSRIVEAFEYVEAEMKQGTSCTKLYQEVRAMLDGWNGHAFPHHLGHGIGLDTHEVPRLNPEWNDTLRLGDVFAVEPALYGPELRAGIRLENDYMITDSGMERLSSFPLDL